MTITRFFCSQKKIVMTTVAKENVSPPLLSFEQFSSLMKASRAVAHAMNVADLHSFRGLNVQLVPEQIAKATLLLVLQAKKSLDMTDVKYRRLSVERGDE